MRFAAFAVSSLLARSALSFAPATTTTACRHHHKIAPTLLFRCAANRSSTTTTSSTQLHAQKKNVAKLSDPERQLLDKVDVFIFDCDGVIWRVRNKITK
jgi:hypothetical protein